MTLPASTISHYRLVRKLGAGTYGEVYEAVHLRSPELRVAIKVVAPALVQDPRFVDALTRECLQLDKLDHPNIVRFRDLVVNERHVAMVLELLDGQDLHARLAGGPLALESALAVVEAILEGLAHAHARGVLHRDIKPGNVFWCDDGRVKLLDFGIARAADGTQATKTGLVVGTLDYTAPERFDDRGGTASSDVYAVGLLAWELLAGRAACPDGEFVRKLGWHCQGGVGDAARVAATLPGCPAWWAEVIASLAARDPALRPADGTAALALLRRKRAEAALVAAPAWRRTPPSTVLEPAPAGSVPPVASSVPPVSVPPMSTGRSAPPVTVMGPAPVSPPVGGAAVSGSGASPAWGGGLAPPFHVGRTPPLALVPPAGAAAPGGVSVLARAVRASGAKYALMVGGVIVLMGGAWFALEAPGGPSLAPAPSRPMLSPVSTMPDPEMGSTLADRSPPIAPSPGSKRSAYLGPKTDPSTPTYDVPLSPPSTPSTPPRDEPLPPPRAIRKKASIRPTPETTSRISTGRVSISAVPRAQISIDGTYLRYTPLYDYSLPVGTHEVLLQTDNLLTKRFTVTVSEGADLTRVWFFDGQEWAGGGQ